MTEPGQWQANGADGAGVAGAAGAVPPTQGATRAENPYPATGYPAGYQDPEEKAATNSLGDLLGEVSADISTLMRQELELAKAELRQSASRAGKGAGMLAGASEAARFTLLFLSIALWAALAYLIDTGWAAVIVAVIWAIIAAILAVVGRKQLSAIRGLPRTTETVQEIPGALKPGKDKP